MEEIREYMKSLNPERKVWPELADFWIMFVSALLIAIASVVW